MTRNLRSCRNLSDLAIRSLALAASLLAVSACQRSSPASSAPAPSPAAATAPAATASTSPGTAAPAAPSLDRPPAQPAPKPQVCSLLSAAEVSAILGKTLVQDGCTYGLDPAEKEREIAKSQEQLQEGMKRATAGDVSSLMKGMGGMAGGGGSQPGAASAMLSQMTISIDADRDGQTEDQIKAVYTKTGGIVRGTLAPEKHGLQGVIEGLDEVSGVGDWAFATNVATANLGPGFSIRGRLLHAGKGPWHVVVGATVAPDPGAAALDNRLAELARALLAKL